MADHPHFLRSLSIALLVGVAYWGGAYLGVTQTITPGGIAIVWPPNAVVLAALLILPRRDWISVIPAVILAEWLADVPAFPTWAALAFGVINLFEVFLAASLIRRFTKAPFRFDTLQQAGIFVLSGPLLASAVAALAGALVYILLGRDETSFLTLWRLWWLGDGLGLLLITPLLVTLWHDRAQLWPLRNAKLIAEYLLLCLLILGLGALVFGVLSPYQPGLPLSPLILLPAVAWAAAKFSVAGTAGAILLIAGLAIGFMVHGAAPYGGLDPQQAVWILQEYLVILVALGVGAAVLLREITSQKLQLLLLDRAIHATSDSIIIADARQPDTPIIWTNPGFEHLFGYSSTEVLGRNCRFLNEREPDQPGVAEVADAIRDQRVCEVILRNYRKSGEPLWIELSIAPVKDGNGDTTHFVGVQHDLTELKATEAALREAKSDLEARNHELEQRVTERTAQLTTTNSRLERLASTDHLTGAANRRSFLQLGQRTIRRYNTSGQPLAMLMLDLDHFKAVNDRYGHLAGDLVLASLGDCIRQYIRPGDLFGRFGGEEFLVLLPGLALEDGERIAERLRQEIEALIIPHEDQSIRVTASMGIASLQPSWDINMLLQSADNALYQAKREGRNRVASYRAANQT
ncbi:diguanylate cyclase [Haliea sp. E1-2-M8]|uniref:sensor domain-containing diguanylate cyclase n=1 Tax=Haliea sp. E1-2-M8 TaxID=3064706 RepID=UPI002717812C|nr:diguanylate cyclase [Haliea sp. E1-2-M8]MDO8861016.1 diguanylate cyclase [Haliea sp. E1-2-M8]